MNSESSKDSLLKELEALRQEIEELRSVEPMRHQTQEGLGVIELQLPGIIQSAMDAIITIDESQKIVLFNAAAEHMFGSSATQAIGKSIDQFIPQRFRDRHRDHVDKFGETQVTNRRMGILGSISGLRANGEEFPLEASISQVERDERRYFTVILRDITERKKAEENLSRLGRLLDESVNEIYLFDATTLKFTQANRGARENLGYTMEELFHMTPLDLKPEYTWDTFEEMIRPLREGKQEKLEFNTVHLRKDRTVYPAEVHLQLSQLETSEVFIAIIMDVTERKGLESQLRQTERLAEMGTLASGMAHEIGTPMNVILGRAEYLMRKTSEESTKKGLATIVTQVERITKIMNQLLGFARRRPIDRRPLALSTVVHEMVDVVQERLERRGIKLELVLDSKCPRVFADRDQMGQVVLNLIMNAIHVMPNGGTLRVKLESHRKQVKLTITDTGYGIPQEHIPKLFTPFFTTKEVGEGTGLGLTVVHGIIQEHEGTILVESEPGEGAMFIVSLQVWDSSKHSV